MAKASLYGYPKKMPDGRMALLDFKGKVLGYGVVLKCTRVRPGTRGAWISSERCSYRFVIDGAHFSCRGRGDGITAACGKMKRPPRSPWWEYNRAARGEPMKQQSSLGGGKRRRRRAGK